MLVNQYAQLVQLVHFLKQLVLHAKNALQVKNEVKMMNLPNASVVRSVLLVWRGRLFVFSVRQANIHTKESQAQNCVQLFLFFYLFSYTTFIAEAVPQGPH